MNIIVKNDIYKIENDLGCAFFKVLLETKDSEVEISLFQDVFSNIYRGELKYEKYKEEYLRQALAYFGHSEHLKLFEAYIEKQKILSFLSENADSVDWESLSRKKTIPVEFFERHLNKVDWEILSRNKNIPVEFFERHLNKVD